ncbi:MAG: ComF family protein [Bacteroidetes bacterium]|nr:ComF family protein [Bacteroidota bacterium]
MKRYAGLGAIWPAFVDILLPRSCCGCGTGLLAQERCVCATCRLGLPLTNWPDHLTNELEKTLLGRVPIGPSTAFLYFKKHSVVQRLLHHLKYKGQKELGVILGIWFGYSLLRKPWADKVGCILPVPLHPKKLKKRGYNQSGLLSMGLSKSMGIPYDFQTLRRTKYTLTQTKMDRYERQENVKDAFECGAMAHEHVLLVDDVVTTGATLESAILAIIKANPNCTVHVASLAMAS